MFARYNMTVISTSSQFSPFDVYAGVSDRYDWQVNVPAGQLFTVMMNDVDGYGAGGVAGLYYVNGTSTQDASCLTASPTASMLPTPTSTGGSGGGGGASGGGSGLTA